MAFWRFNATGAVQLYEAFIPNLALWVKVGNGEDLNDVTVQAQVINLGLCPAIQQACTGTNQVYQDVAVSGRQYLTIRKM